MEEIFKNYRLVQIESRENWAFAEPIFLNNKITVEEFQKEIDRIKEEHQEEINEYGDDLNIILSNIELDFRQIPYNPDEILYI